MPDITVLPDLVTPATATDGIVTYDSSKDEGARITEIKFSNDDGEYLNGKGGWGALSGDPTVTTVSASTHSLALTDNILHVTYSATGACTITWPTAQMVSGRLIRIKDAGGDASSNNITLATEGSQTVDGESTYVMNLDYSCLTVYCDGSNLFILTETAAASTPNITTVNAATYSLLATDNILNVTYTTTGSCTVTWPTAQMTSGRVVTIKDGGGDAKNNNITIVTGGSETIDGASSYTMSRKSVSVTVFCDGTNLFIT